MTTWSVRVEYATPTAPDRDELGAALAAGGGITASPDGDRSRTALSVLVEANTARQALEAGLRRTAAIAHLVEGFGDLVRFEALTDEELERDLRRPPLPKLAGVAEVAEILGVSKQRVSQLANEHGDFPAPVDELASGRVYTRASIEAFGERWERKRTGRPRKADQA